MKVLVGLSGGVDSSVAAMLLKQQGHDVIGATMAIWGDRGVKEQLKDKLPQKHGACLGPDEAEDIESARKIAEQIGIPFYVFDCAKQYEEIVLNNFKKEYLSGHTPNPCVWCNSLIKFDALPKLAKLNGIDFDKFATGHYANIEETEDGRYILKRGLDPKKDQSYFLYRLKQEQLAKIMFPLGGYSKDEIRSLAKEFGLLSAEKPDSQDFYAGDYNELLGVEEKEGNIVDLSGKILGKHKGIWNYTIGQRKGVGVSSTEPLYVIELRKDTNEVVIGPKDKTMKDYLRADDINWIIKPKDSKITCLAKIRSTQLPVPVTVEIDDNGFTVKFVDMQKSIALGQSVVLYDGDCVLGGGIITNVY